MTLSMFIKEEFNFRHDQIWLWVCLSKEKLTLGMSKYDFEYVLKGKVDFIHIQIWLWVCLSKEKFDFRHNQIWLWVCLSKKNLTLDMSKYDFEYVCQRKSWL
jgi:hypothetical protein